MAEMLSSIFVPLFLYVTSFVVLVTISDLFPKHHRLRKCLFGASLVIHAPMIILISGVLAYIEEWKTFSKYKGINRKGNYV